MAYLPIPMNPLHKNLDSSELVMAIGAVFNMYDNHAKHFKKRPGLDDLSFEGEALTEKIDGSFWSPFDKTLYLSSGAELFYIKKYLQVLTCAKVTETNCLFADILTQGKTPIFARIDNKVFIANEKHIGLLTIGGSPELEDLHDYSENSPTKCTGIAYHNKKIIASQKGSDVIFWSEVNNYTSWPAENFATAESDSDKIMTIGVAWGELTLFGERTIEGWYDDGAGFSAKLGAVVQGGVGARSSVTEIDSIWYFLDNNRNIVRYSPGSRELEDLSFPIAEDIQEMDVVSDAVGHYLSINGHKLYVISFKRANRTYVYNVSLGTWHQWSFWNPTTHSHDDFLGNSYTFAEDWQLHIWGDRRVGNGSLYFMTKEIFTDSGNLMKCTIQTGLIDRDSLNEKLCNRIRIKLKRGTNALDNSPALLQVRWRDDNKSWGNPVTLDLGYIGDNKNTVTLNALGRYITRQWEFSTDSKCDIILMEVFEDFEVLQR